MKQLGRRHRHFYRIVAIDARQPRDGRVIEELGTYNPFVKSAEAGVVLSASRIKYWMSVGAKPSERVGSILKRHLEAWEKKEAEAEAAKAAPQATEGAAPAPEASPAPGA